MKTKYEDIIYTGERDATGECSVKVNGSNLDPRWDLYRHSEGFEWGYLGSGPAQLALAICSDATGNDERTLNVYQQFKEEFVALLDRKAASWSITMDKVLLIITKIEAKL